MQDMKKLLTGMQVMKPPVVASKTPKSGLRKMTMDEKARRGL